MTQMNRQSALKSTDWLAEQLANPAVAKNLRLVDASFFLPNSGGNAAAEFAQTALPNAVFFDIELICDKSTRLPHMVAPPAEFEAAVRSLGINADSVIIAYDRVGLMSAARVWWNFRYYGHEQVFVLDGGMPKWLAEGRALSAGKNPPLAHGAQSSGAAKPFVAKIQPRLRKTIDELVANLAEPRFTLIDARSSGRFNGTDPEPRAGLSSGHVPKSLSLPFSSLLAADQTLLAPNLLRQKFQSAGYDIEKPQRLPAVTSCGSGVTACVLALALFECGLSDVPIYDGSWAEWASSGNPISSQ